VKNHEMGILSDIGLIRGIMWNSCKTLIRKSQGKTTHGWLRHTWTNVVREKGHKLLSLTLIKSVMVQDLRLFCSKCKTSEMVQYVSSQTACPEDEGTHVLRNTVNCLPMATTSETISLASLFITFLADTWHTTCLQQSSLLNLIIWLKKIK
jgi:hypothetical protein